MALVFDIISIVFEISKECYNIAEEVKSFKMASKNLAERIKLLTDGIRVAHNTIPQSEYESKNYGIFLDALKDLEKHVKDIKSFLKQLKEMSCFEKLITKCDIKGNFEFFNTILDDLVPALTLIFGIQQRDELIKKLQEHQDFQEAIKNDIENIGEILKIILSKLEEDKKSLPDKSSIPTTDLKMIKYKELKGLKKHEAHGMFGELLFAKYEPFGGVKVAIKKLPNTKEVKKNLTEEAQLLKKLESPSIVQLWGICIEEPNNMIVFEYMENGTLRNVLDKHTELDYAKRQRMAIDCALGLHHIHHLEMVHRALTSSKYLVDQYFKVKLSDVGLTKTWKSALEHSLVRTEEQKKYYAPELLTDINQKYNSKCEIYCFGIVVWEIITGKIPFKGMSDDEIVQSTLDGKKLEPVNFKPVDKLISDCMETDPLIRPKISEIIAQLRQVLKDHRETPV